MKQHRPPILLDRLTKHEDINFRAGDKDPRLKQAVVTEDHILNNKEAICGNLLEQGYVQSFIDLFYISHKCLPNVMDRRNYFGEQLHIPEYLLAELDLQ